jgi:hypothetical protein
MIPDIGLMVAAYIITRLTAMLGRPNESVNVVAKVFAIITILVTLVCVVDLLGHGLSAPSPR